MQIFLKIMYLPTDETSTLEILKIKIFLATQPWWADF